MQQMEYDVPKRSYEIKHIDVTVFMTSHLTMLIILCSLNDIYK